MSFMLDVAIGLIFVYLVLSLLCSAISEALEHYLRYRAHYLRQGIEKLLLSGNTDLSAALYAHPLIKSLYTQSVFEGKGRSGGPSYIPSRQFVLALLDIVSNQQATSNATTAVADLRAAIDANQTLPAPLARALRTLINDAGGDIEKVKSNVQQWFDGSMDRVSGWYKRRAQFVLLIIGAVVSVVVNVDTMSIIDTLSNDSAIRTAVVNAADAYVRNNPRPSGQSDANGASQPAPTGTAAPTGTTPPANGETQVTADVKASVEAVSKQLGALGLPVGWRYDDENRGGMDEGLASKTPDAQRRYRIENRIWPRSLAEWKDQLGSHLLGWVLTAFALSFGAPFWFDMLNKIMVIRSTVKPREKSGEEGSEDRPVRAQGQTVRIEVAGAKP